MERVNDGCVYGSKKLITLPFGLGEAGHLHLLGYY